MQRNKMGLLGIIILLSNLYYLYSPSPSNSALLSAEEVGAAVLTWVRYVTADARPDAQIDSVTPFLRNKEIVGYIVSLKDGGYCLCGADDRALPVYLYNPKGIYDPADPFNKMVLKEIADRNSFFKTNSYQLYSTQQIPIDEIFQQRLIMWQELMSGNWTKKQARKTLQGDIDLNVSHMELDFNAKWHQHSPYNEECPFVDFDNAHVVVGCVATAMSQIMYYWKWPSKGTGKVSTIYRAKYLPPSLWRMDPLDFDPGIPPQWNNRLRWRTYGTESFLEMTGWWDKSVLEDAQAINSNLSYQSSLQSLYDGLPDEERTYEVDLGTQPNYEWDKIKDLYSSTTEVGADHVARLNYHVGLAVTMNYGLRSSTSDISKAASAFKEHFYYDPDVTQTNLLDALHLHDLLSDEIKWLRPIQAKGQDDEGNGHSFVIYGYDTSTDPDRQFLINFGWGPNHAHVWYTLSSVRYNNFQDYLYRIAPLNVKFAGTWSLFNDGSPSDPYNDLSTAIANAPSHGTIILKAGGTYSIPEGVIEPPNPMTIKGFKVLITK